VFADKPFIENVKPLPQVGPSWKPMWVNLRSRFTPLLSDFITGTAVEHALLNGSFRAESTHPTAAEISFVSCVLLDVGRLTFLCSIRVVFVLHQFYFRSGVTLAPRPFFAAVSRRNRWQLI
jgi:hypothetical protein